MAGHCASSILQHSWRVYLFVIIVAILLAVGNFIIEWIVDSIAPNLLRPGWPLSGGKDATDQGFGPITLNSGSALLAPSFGDCELLMLGKSDLSEDKCRAQLSSSGAWSFLLRNFGGDSGPDLSFDKSASPDCLFSSALKSGFFLIDRRAIPDAMVWRDTDATIDDTRPAAGSFNMADVRRLSAHVIKLRDMPE
ncbi:hypothetical protein Tco_0236821, partial [Tanacetum coccineum]